MPDRNAETLLHESALAAAPYGAFICAADGRFRYVNAAYEQLTGYRAEELIGRRSFDSLHDPAELARRRAELPGVGSWGVGTPGSVSPGSVMAPTRYESEWTYVRRNNTRIPVMLALSPLSPLPAGDPAVAPKPHRADEPVAFDDGARLNPAGYVGIAVEMTRYAQSEAKLWYVSHHDGVTRLPNQTLFAERLDLTLTRCRRDGASFTVLLVELNTLRKVRDALGSYAAELVLQIVGERLRSLIAYEGTIA